MFVILVVFCTYRVIFGVSIQGDSKVGAFLSPTIGYSLSTDININKRFQPPLN